ncbi:hypothetical protein ACJX0J_022225 [Zea mays]
MDLAMRIKEARHFLLSIQQLRAIKKCALDRDLFHYILAKQGDGACLSDDEDLDFEKELAKLDVTSDTEKKEDNLMKAFVPTIDILSIQHAKTMGALKRVNN